MNNMNTAANSTSTNLQGSNGTERQLQSAGNGGHAAGERSRELANQTFDQLASAVESARNSAVPAIEKLTTSAGTMAQRSAELAREKSKQLREQALLASELTAGYVRQAPVKSLLIAAAAGALLTLIFSSGKRERV